MGLITKPAKLIKGYGQAQRRVKRVVRRRKWHLVHEERGATLDTTVMVHPRDADRHRRSASAWAEGPEAGLAQVNAVPLLRRRRGGRCRDLGLAPRP